MKRGRKTKPTALKVITGNPGKRPLNDKEPKPVVRLPTAPPHLSGPAKTEWKRVSKELYNLGLLSGMDRGALAAYCQSYGRWRTAEIQLSKSSLTIKTSNLNVIQNPLVGIARGAMSDMMRYAAEFGMTPSARSRIEASPLEAPSDAAAKDEYFDD